MTTIFVRNNSDDALRDGYSGTEYVFEPNSEIEIPEDAAKHIFGYDDDNKEPYLVRLGWMKMNTDFPIAMDRLRKFSFARERSKPVHLSAPVVERVAAPLPKTRGAAKAPVKDE
jgi:hypothetical protein